MTEPIWKAFECPISDAEAGSHCTNSFGVGVAPHKARKELASQPVNVAGTVERAMRSRTPLEVAWFDVCQVQEESA